MSEFCPATMCPLFAAEGSPWTGDKNALCSRSACLWWSDDGCQGCVAALDQISDVGQHGATLQIGPRRQRRARAKPREYDCPRAHECQWQIECAPALCPPRWALARGIDPKASAY